MTIRRLLVFPMVAALCGPTTLIQGQDEAKQEQE